jgi:hypothetical protein
MEFEFDPEKSKSNKDKHGIDFNEGQKLWEDPDHIVIPAKNLDEPRFLVIGKIRDKIWSSIITIRNQKIRIISIRRSRNNEKEIYKG